MSKKSSEFFFTAHSQSQPSKMLKFSYYTPPPITPTYFRLPTCIIQKIPRDWISSSTIVIAQMRYVGKAWWKYQVSISFAKILDCFRKFVFTKEMVPQLWCATEKDQLAILIFIEEHILGRWVKITSTARKLGHFFYKICLFVAQGHICNLTYLLYIKFYSQGHRKPIQWLMKG